MENKFELTKEQVEAVEEFSRKVVQVVRIMVDAVKTLWERMKSLICEASTNFKAYIMRIEPKKRYKLLKSIGVKNYIQFFRRDGIIHCRNNC